MYSRFGCDRERFKAKSIRKTTQIMLSYFVRSVVVASFSGSNSAAMIASESTVSTRMNRS